MGIIKYVRLVSEVMVLSYTTLFLLNCLLLLRAFLSACKMIHPPSEGCNGSRGNKSRKGNKASIAHR